jgi:rhodanese-related sulfurtransferase
MKKSAYIIKFVLAAVLIGPQAHAAEPSKWATVAPKKERQTPQGLYITAKNTYEWMQEDDKVILVDVRTPAEWQFVGYSPMAQIMIPSVLFQYDALDSKNSRYKSVINEKFINEFEEKLFDLGADKDTTYVLMCRSGATRAQPAAKMLDQYGYKNVYIMTDGFEGGKLKDGDRKGWRLKTGWKVSNPPTTWTYKIDPNRAYLER